MMRVFSLFMPLFLLLGLCHAEAKELMPPKASQQVRVLLEKNCDEVLLEVKGPYTIYDPQNNSRVASGLLGKRFLVHAEPNGVKWGEQFLGIFQIRVEPKAKEPALLVNGKQYAGTISVFAVNGKISIVNELKLEDYITSILTKEFVYPLESEVMSALAILARTNASYLVNKNSSSLWHIDAKDSGYEGVALNTPNSFVQRVVENTKDLILVHSHEGLSLPFPTSWTEHSAGKTASFAAIYRKEKSSFDKGVDAPHAKIDRDEAKWQFHLTKNTLADLFSMPELESIELFIDKESNKTYGVRLKSESENRDLSFFEFQEKLGKNRLQSNDFKVSAKGNSVDFTGFGKGPGVGLCLYSASQLAQNGENALSILSKFYPQSYLLNLSALPKKKVYQQEEELD